MTQEELKQRVHEAIERHAPAIIAVGEQIRRHPELGFKELRTAALVEAEFRRLGLVPRTGLALTGVRAEVAGGAGQRRTPRRAPSTPAATTPRSRASWARPSVS